MPRQKCSTISLTYLKQTHKRHSRLLENLVTIAGMQNFISAYPQYRHKVKYYLAIFCAGMPSYKATEKALATFGKKEKPQTLRYRGDGWPGYFTATYQDGASCRMTYNESWGKILGRDLGFRCKICPDGILVFWPI